MKRVEDAVEKFTGGYNCAQSVFSSFAQEVGIDPDTALRIACGFGAGMSRKQEVCGAVTGAAMVIGMKYGRGDGEGPERTGETYKKVRSLMDSFALEHGTWNCKELLGGCDLMTPEGQKELREKDLHNKVCAKCVRTSSEILADLLG